MAYTPENNPYIPGDPYSYDLKWMVDKIKGWKDPADSAERAKASEEAAAASAQAAADSAQDSADSASASAGSAAQAKNYADNISNPVSGIVTTWLSENITEDPTVIIDKSLTVSGAAADAKAVGDSFNPLEQYTIPSPNLFNPTGGKNGGYYNSSGSWIVNSSVNTSNLIKIDPGYVYYTNYNPTKRIDYYNSAGEWVAQEPVSQPTGNIITPNSAYSFFTLVTSANTAYPITISKYMLLSKYVGFDKADLSWYQLNDKNVLVLGDSITATANRWINQFKNRLHPMTLTNLAVSGAHLRDYYNTPFPYDGNPNNSNQVSNVLGNQVQKYVNGIASSTYPNADICFIFIGTNDNWDYESGINIEDSFTSNGNYIPVNDVDRKIFAGAMRWSYERLIRSNAYMQVFWITPIQCAEGVRPYTQQKNKADRIRAVADRMACYCIDAFNNSGIYGRYENAGSVGTWLSDGLHPSEKGGIHLGNYIADAYSALHSSDYYATTINWTNI